MPYLGEAAELFGQLEDARRRRRSRSTQRPRASVRDGKLESLEAWQRVQSLCRQLGDARGQLDAMEGIARAIRQIDGATDACVAAFEAALELASTLRDGRRALACRNTLGIVEWARENHAAALLHYEAALLLARGQEDRVQEGVVLNGLGVTLSKLNRPEEARTVLEESAALNRETGERLLEAHAHAALGHVSRSLGRFDRAAESFERSLELRRAAGDRVGEAWMWRRLAETRAALGQEAAARDAADAAATLAAASGDAALIAACAARAAGHTIRGTTMPRYIIERSVPGSPARRSSRRAAALSPPSPVCRTSGGSAAMSPTSTARSTASTTPPAPRRSGNMPDGRDSPSIAFPKSPSRSIRRCSSNCPDLDPARRFVEADSGVTISTECTESTVTFTNGETERTETKRRRRNTLAEWKLLARARSGAAGADVRDRKQGSRSFACDLRTSAPGLPRYARREQFARAGSHPGLSVSPSLTPFLRL